MELIVVSILIAIGLGLWWQISKKTSSHRTRKPLEHHHPYAAVQLLPCVNACDSAHKAAKNTYLTTEIQQIPINDCNKVESCDCKFKHLDDRRHQEDRRSFSFVLQDVFHAEERRNLKKSGRRHTDGFLQYE